MFTEDHKISLELYPSLIYLSLINIGLESLENFPNLKLLEIVSYKKYSIKHICIVEFE